jgi:hypothetical protein
MRQASPTHVELLVNGVSKGIIDKASIVAYFNNRLKSRKK